MALIRVAVEGIRCFREPVIANLIQRDLLIQGPNGSGKTTFLEAIYTTMRGRSFRTGDLNRMISDGKKSFESRIDFSLKNEQHANISFRFDGTRRKAELEMNGTTITHSDISNRFPFVYVNRDLVDIVSGEPARKRGVLDWVAFHVEHDHVTNLRNFRKAYIQWRECVRMSMPGEESWWRQAANTAEVIETSRSKAYASLVPMLDQNVIKLLPGRSIVFSYSAGFDPKIDYKKIRETILKGARLFSSPLLSTFTIRVDGTSDIRGHLSRGQQKRLAIGIMWAAMDAVSNVTGKDVHVLFDDFPSDLDPISRKDVFGFITGGKHQLILASQESCLVDKGDLGTCSTWNIA